MFGFSFTKLIVLAAIVVAVWYGFKFVGRLDKRRKEQLASSRKASTAEMKDVGDMLYIKNFHFNDPRFVQDPQRLDYERMGFAAISDLDEEITSSMGQGSLTIYDPFDPRRAVQMQLHEGVKYQIYNDGIYVAGESRREGEWEWERVDSFISNAFTEPGIF